MRKTHMIMATALTLALAASATFADAKPTRHRSVSDARANAITAELNRKQIEGTVTASGTVDANGNSLSNSTGVDATSNINSAAATTDKSSVPAGSMSSTTNSAVAGDNSQAPAGSTPTTDSTVPNSGQNLDQATPQPEPSKDKGATGKNPNPTDATDTPQ